jgi:hypothetical protein
MARLSARPSFNPAAFLVVMKQTATIGGVPVKHGDVLKPGSLDHLGPRKAEMMYASRWVDHASDAQIAAHLGLTPEEFASATAFTVLSAPAAPGKMLEDAGPLSTEQIAKLAQLPPEIKDVLSTLDPPAPPAAPKPRFELPEGFVLNGTDRLPAMLPVNGVDMQLGRIVLSAFRDVGISGADWNALEEAARDEIIINRARSIGWAGEPLTATAPPPAATAPGEPVAVFHEGFGRWFGRDANGLKVGERMTAAQAEATLLPKVDK